jgi:hypothetical protein
VNLTNDVYVQAIGSTNCEVRVFVKTSGVDLFSLNLSSVLKYRVSFGWSKVAHKSDGSAVILPPNAVSQLIGSYTDGLPSVDDTVMCHSMVRRMRVI